MFDDADSSSGYSSDYSSSSDSSYAPSVLIQQLEAEVNGKVHAGIDLVNFVQQVWGLDSLTIDRLLSIQVSLGDSQKNNYFRSESRCEAYRSFLSVASGLVEAAVKGLGEETLGDISLDWLNDRSAGDSVRHMPGAVNLWTAFLPSDEVPELSLAKGVLELKWNMDQEDEADSQSSREDLLGFLPEGSTTINGGRQVSFEGASNVLDDGDDGHPLRGSMLPLYAMEALSLGSRYYVNGLLVDGFQVTVCYFDHFIVACTKSFSFEDDPAKLALALYALNRCDLARAGFDPHLRKSCSHSRGPGDSASFDCRLPVEDVVGSYFEYPPALVQSVDSQPSTHVCLHVSEVIQRPQELIGRATAVYKVRRHLADGTFSGEPIVYKLSWESARSMSPVDIVKGLKQTLPEEVHDYLPDFILTTTLTAQCLHLPWPRLGLALEKQEEPLLRGTLGKFYHHLWEAGSIDNFKRAWLDCVECEFLTLTPSPV